MTYDVPAHFVKLCHDYHDGQVDLLYEIGSTGKVEFSGPIEWNHEFRRPLTTRESTWKLLVRLESRLRLAKDDARTAGRYADMDDLYDFMTLCREWADELATEHNLQTEHI
jgi:hypothetical protein